MYLVIDSYITDLLDLEAIEEASQDYLRLTATGDMPGDWARSLPVQHPAPSP